MAWGRGRARQPHCRGPTSALPQRVEGRPQPLCTTSYRHLARVDNDLTETQWSLIMEAWGGCAYCTSTTRALQKDCVLPVSRGGRYTLTNVVPACASCNASKHNGEVSSWMRRKGFDEPAFLLRWAEIVSHLALAT